MVGKRSPFKPSHMVYLRPIEGQAAMYDPEKPPTAAKSKYSDMKFEGVTKTLVGFDAQGSVIEDTLKLAVRVMYEGEPVWVKVRGVRLEDGAYVGYTIGPELILVRPRAKDFKTVDGLIKALYSATYQNLVALGTINGARVHSPRGKVTLTLVSSGG